MDISTELILASKTLAGIGLNVSNRWILELLQGYSPTGSRNVVLPPSLIDPNYYAIEDADPSYSTYLISKALFDNREYERAVFFIDSHFGTVVAPQRVDIEFSEYSHELSRLCDGNQRLLFIKLYSLYLEGESIRARQRVQGSKSFIRNRNGLNPNINKLESLLSSLYSENRLDAFGLYLYGIVLKDLERRDVSISVLYESLKLFPWNYSAWVDLIAQLESKEELDSLVIDSNSHWLFGLYRALALSNLQQNGLSLKALQPYSAIFPKASTLKAFAAKTLYQSSLFPEAERLYRHIYEQDPHCLHGIITYSHVLFTQNDTASLASLAQKASRRPFTPESCCIIANLYIAKNQFEKGIMYLQRALRFDPNLADAWTLMGQAFTELQRTPSAIECYRRALDINPKDFNALYGIGLTYELIGIFSLAFYSFRKASLLRPGDSLVWVSLGSCLERLDRIGDAVAAYRRAYYNLGGRYHVASTLGGNQSTSRGDPAAYAAALRQLVAQGAYPPSLSIGRLLDSSYVPTSANSSNSCAMWYSIFLQDVALLGVVAQRDDFNRGTLEAYKYLLSDKLRRMDLSAVEAIARQIIAWTKNGVGNGGSQAISLAAEARETLERLPSLRAELAAASESSSVRPPNRSESGSTPIGRPLGGSAVSSSRSDSLGLVQPQLSGFIASLKSHPISGGNVQPFVPGIASQRSGRGAVGFGIPSVASVAADRNGFDPSVAQTPRNQAIDSEKSGESSAEANMNVLTPGWGPALTEHTHFAQLRRVGIAESPSLNPLSVISSDGLAVNFGLLTRPHSRTDETQDLVYDLPDTAAPPRSLAAALLTPPPAFAPGRIGDNNFPDSSGMNVSSISNLSGIAAATPAAEVNGRVSGGLPPHPHSHSIVRGGGSGAPARPVHGSTAVRIPSTAASVTISDVSAIAGFGTPITSSLDGERVPIRHPVPHSAGRVRKPIHTQTHFHSEGNFQTQTHGQDQPKGLDETPIVAPEDITSVGNRFGFNDFTMDINSPSLQLSFDDSNANERTRARVDESVSFFDVDASDGTDLGTKDNGFMRNQSNVFSGEFVEMYGESMRTGRLFESIESVNYHSSNNNPTANNIRSSYNSGVSLDTGSNFEFRGLYESTGGPSEVYEKDNLDVDFSDDDL